MFIRTRDGSMEGRGALQSGPSIMIAASLHLWWRIESRKRIGTWFVSRWEESNGSWCFECELYYVYMSFLAITVQPRQKLVITKVPENSIPSLLISINFFIWPFAPEIFSQTRIMNRENWDLSSFYVRIVWLTKKLMMTEVVGNSISILLQNYYFFMRSTVLKIFAKKCGINESLWIMSSNNSGMTELSQKLQRTKAVENLIRFQLNATTFSIRPTVLEIFAKNQIHQRIVLIFMLK